MTGRSRWALFGLVVTIACVVSTPAWAAPAAERVSGNRATSIRASAPATPTIMSPVDGSKTPLYVIGVKVGVSADTTGISILRDGSEVASATVSGETSVTVDGVGLHLGYNSLLAVACNESGETSSAPAAIQVVGRVGKPRLSGVFQGRVFPSRRPTIRGRTGANTTALELWVNKRRVRIVRVGSYRAFALRRVPLRYRGNRIAVVALNEFYRRSSGTYRVWRLDIKPYFRTMIVVDKSDRRVYFIRRHKLVAYYKCAIGKPSTPTPERVWRIDSKEYTDPSSAYGPRRMRLFARRWNGHGYSYEYTSYGIHGTDTPSSIGKMASHGCIRLFSWAILRLFPMVPLHTMVVTRA